MDKAKKKQVKKIVTWSLLAALVAGLAAMPLLAKKGAEADGPVASILSGKVEEGSIRTSLSGGGTLAVEDMEDIRIPSGVKITEFLVKNGDRVTEGTPLAAVDQVSVMTAITSVTDTLEYLQSEMKSAKNETVSSTVSATAGGRIKKVYGQKGDSVQRVMLEHGSLALLSLDGLMAVKIERKLDLPTGQSVEVTLADGTEVTGRVESNLKGEIVITVEDKGYAIGEKVTVKTNDGDRVGNGELYVHNAWRATAYSGTIQNVQAKEENKVNSGATLFTLTDTDFRGDLEYLSALHREYEALMQELFSMYNTGTINAPCTGMVSGVDKDSAHLLSADGEEDVHVDLLTTEETGWEIVLLSAVTYADGECGSDTCPLVGNHTVETCPKNQCTQSKGCTANSHDPNCIEACTGDDRCDPEKAHNHKPECIHSCNYDPETQTCPGTGYHKNNCIMSCQHASVAGGCGSKTEADPHYLDCIYACKKSDDATKDCPAVKHWPGCIESCTHADTPDACSATPNHYADCILSCTTSKTGEDCPATKHNSNCYFYGMSYTAKVAKVDRVGSDALVVRWDASGTSYKVEKKASGWELAPGSNFSTDLLVNEGTLPVGKPKSFKAGDIILYVTGTGAQKEWTGVVVYKRSTAAGAGGLDMSGLAGMGGLPGFSGLSGMGGISGLSGMGGMSGISGMGGSTGMTSNSIVDASKLFDLNGSVLLTVTPETTATLSVTLDEQDIAKVYVGQKATVKVQALGKEAFEAEVVEISNHGENNGGNSKFAVKLRFNKTHNMIDGMSATAVLDVENQETVPVIPVAALTEKGSKTVVYTARDEKTGELTKPVEVTLGASDGEYAQILSGLSLGDTYYYSYYDTVEVSTAV